MKQADYTISDIIRLKPTWFMAKQSNQDTATTHLDSIARMIDYGFGHIATYNFIHCFGSFDIGSKQISDINRSIAMYREPVAAASTNLVPRLVSPFMTNHEKLLSLCKTDDAVWQTRISNANNAYKSANDDVSYWNNKMEEVAKDIRAAYKALKEHEDNLELIKQKYETLKDKLDISQVQMLRKLPKHWTVIDVTKDDVTLFRNTPVTIRWTNANTGMNKTLYMGFYAFKLNLCDFSLIKAQVVADGQSCINPCHPHISSYICFGNMQHQANKARDAKDLAKYISYVDSILETYNEGNPFRSLTSYISGKNKYYTSVINSPFHSWFRSQQFYSFLSANASSNYVHMSSVTSRRDKQLDFVSKMTSYLDYRKDKIRLLSDSFSKVPDNYKSLTTDAIKLLISSYSYITNDYKKLTTAGCYSQITHRDYSNRYWPVVVACMRVMGIKLLKMKDFSIEIRGDFPQVYQNTYGDRFYIDPAPNSVIVKNIYNAGEVIIDEGIKDPVLTDFESDKEEVAQDAIPF